MRQTSHTNTARRYFTAGIVALSISVTAVVLGISGDHGTTTKNAVAVSSVVRTGATAATATVTGSATGASAVALPNTSGSETVLAMCGVFLTLCGAAAFALVRTSRQEHRTH